MKRILFTTKHPALYINQMCDILEKEYAIDVVYEKRDDKEKEWKTVNGKDGLFYDQLTLFSFLQKVFSYDMVIIGGWKTLYGIIAIILSPLFKTKCAVYSDHPDNESVKHKAYFFKKYLLFKCVDYIFCATESTRVFYHENYGVNYNKLKLLPYAYNSTCSDQEVVENNQKRKKLLSNPDEKKRLFIASRFIERKGYGVVADTFRKMKDANILDTFDITIAGSGPLKDTIEKQIKQYSPYIKFVGWIETDEYINYINNCDIYLHASIQEPFGIPPLDALAREKLLIVSHGVESVNGLVQNGVNGYVYKSTDSDMLFSIFSEITNSSIYKIGKEGKKVLVKAYNNQVYFNTVDSCFL